MVIFHSYVSLPEGRIQPGPPPWEFSLPSSEAPRARTRDPGGGPALCGVVRHCSAHRRPGPTIQQPEMGKNMEKRNAKLKGLWVYLILSDSIWFYLILWLRIPVGIAHSKFQRPYLYFVLVSLCVCMKIKTPKPVLRETAAAAFSKISSSSSTLEDSWPSHAKTVTETLWLYGMSDRISSFICVSHYYIWLYLLISLIISGKNILYHISLSNCIWLFLIISYLYMYVYV